MTHTKTLLCFGYGYSARALAALLAPQGWRIIGTSRGGGAEPGADNCSFAGAWEEGLDRLVRRSEAILLSIPPDAAGDIALRAFADAFRSRDQGWIGYLSTTGVYGDLGGRWAFEWTPPHPCSDQGARRALAERQALSLPRPACVFRLPGIYGPGRSPLDRLRTGDMQRLDKPGQVFSRIHVQDLAQALLLSIERSAPGRIYNVCDDEPAPSPAPISFAADLLGLELPPIEPFALDKLSPMAQRFWAENKRVSNARIKAELGWRPRFPSFREGLGSLHEQCDSRTH